MLNVIILAAGKGTRMKSDKPKVLFEAAGKTMIEYAADLAESLEPRKIIAVTGFKADMVEESLKHRNIEFARQIEQNGTADAVKTALEHINDTGKTLIICGDMPLMKHDTIKRFMEAAAVHPISFISVKTDNPEGYGRVIRSSSGAVLKITEEKDANRYEKRIKEVNTGVYLCDNNELKKRVTKIDKNNAQGEYYLTDIVKGGAFAFTADSEQEFMGVNDRGQLAAASKIIWRERAEKAAKEGVSIMDTDSVYIGCDVKIAPDTVIYPNVYIENKTVIGKNTVIMPGCRINNSVIGDNCVIKDNSLIEQSFVGDNSQVGPMAHLRPDSRLEGDNKVGNFVELKKTVMGTGSKASHLTYLGDAELGENVNIGCGTITCNYDGHNKYKTIIGDNVFVGSDTQFVAPVTIGSGALIGAGSTITRDVEENALAVSRTPQRNLENKGSEIIQANLSKKQK